MVQKKVPNKLGIKANCLKTENMQQPNTKTFLHNHDAKNKGADLKTKKMKKSRLIKRSDPEISLRASPRTHARRPRQPGKPPTLVSPSPKKPSSYKHPHESPNYMRSTSCSEARMEQTKVSISSPSKPQRVAKKQVRTSSLNRVRTLTKAPSFKHKIKTPGNRCSKKVVLCDDLDVKRATCSSTQKKSKFPPYLRLSPGATEAEGTSFRKVCPYNYCSLNGHHHNPSPPFKCFLSSKRKVLKKVAKPGVITTDKPKALKNDVKEVDSGVCEMPKVDQTEDFFVEIYVPGSGHVSENGFSDHMNLSPEKTQDEDCGLTLTLVQDQTSTECSYGESLDKFIGKTLNMEWEEGKICAIEFDKEDDITTEMDSGYDHEELTECQSFSDDSSRNLGGLIMFKEDDSNINSAPENEIDEIVKAQNDGDEANEANYITKSPPTKIEDKEDSRAEVDQSEAGNYTEEVIDSFPSEDFTESSAELHSNEEAVDSNNKIKWSLRCTKAEEGSEGEREFNPREPNYLPIKPDPEGEKVDLRHQEMDERRNSEEWMLDYALRNAVNQLAPARKKKVALLVEAFEAVTPMPKWEPHMRRNSSGFAHARAIQACS